MPRHEKAQEEFTQYCERSVQEAENDPLRTRKEEIQLAFLEAAASGNESALRKLLNPERELVPFMTEFKPEAVAWAQGKKNELAMKLLIESGIEASKKTGSNGYPSK